MIKKRKVSRKRRKRRSSRGKLQSKKESIPPLAAPALPQLSAPLPTRPTPPPTKTKIDIEQFKVLNQFGAGGGASCGYHALKNGILIARYFDGLEGSKENLDARLNDEELVSELFGENGKWRNLVRTKRNKYVLQYLIGEQLKGAILKPKDYDELRNQFDDPQLREEMDIKIIRNIVIRDAYSSKMSDIARKWSDEIVEKNITIKPEKILIKTIEDEKNFSLPYLEKGYYMSKEGGLLADRNEVIAYLKKPGTLKYFIDIKKLKDISFSMENLSDAYDEYNVHANEVGFARQFPGGDWLNDDEIKTLYKLENEFGGMLYKSSAHFAVIQDINAPYETIIKNAKKDFDENQNLTYAFVLGTMSVKYSSGMGHWFTVVVHQKEGHKKFITTDSLGIDRTKDSIVGTLIEGIS